MIKTEGIVQDAMVLPLEFSTINVSLDGQLARATKYCYSEVDTPVTFRFVVMAAVARHAQPQIKMTGFKLL